MAEVSIEQVRQHLEELGYKDVPAHVLEDFTAELRSRVGGGKHANHDTAVGSGKQEGLRERKASESNIVRRNVTRERGTRLGGKPAVMERETDAEDDEFAQAADARRRITEQASGRAGVRREGSVAGSVRSSAGSVASSSYSTASYSTSSIIRPQSASRPKRSDPVAKFQQVSKEWSGCPSVVEGGAKKKPLIHVPSTDKPVDKKIWKSVHPLDNSEGTDLSYVVPTSKSRVKEMVEVRDSLKWNEVYKPSKTDRVWANEQVRSYVIPDDKRRDEVRWNTRVKMHMVS